MTGVRLRNRAGNAAGVAAVLAIVAVAGGAAARADVTLPKLITDGMVLQQKAPVRLWGKASPGEKVVVTLQDKSGTATADPEGNWMATLKDLKPGGPFTLTVRGNNTVEVKDVLVGEVWVCSGQSNMEWPLSAAENGPAEAAAANDPQLRMFTVQKRVSPAPEADVLGGKWEAASPQTAGRFSAVGYYFARALRASRKVPIGMINTSWGGTRIEAWTRKEVLLENGVAPKEYDVYQVPEGDAKAKYERQLAAYREAGAPTGSFPDPGIRAEAQGWAAIDLDTAAAAGWAALRVPGVWEESGVEALETADGVVWVRREFDVPAAPAGKPATLSLGPIDDTDTTFVNGVRVGATGPGVAQSWEKPRAYPVPAGVLKAGRNVVAVRVWDGQGDGGFSGQAGALSLSFAGGPSIALAGEWRYRAENVRPSAPVATAPYGPNSPSALYNGMLAPLTKYTITGAIWYQGESNAGQPQRYRTLMPAMIQNWRDDFGIPNFPFFMVQLAPFNSDNPQGTNWPELREAQYLTTTLLPNVGMAVITDVGDAKDIHPRKKAPVGERLALLARRVAYGERGVVAMGPTVKKTEDVGDRIVVEFDNVGQGLEARGGRLVGWEIAGADGKYYPAEATIVGKNKVAVRSPEVRIPFHVRYGWANYREVNLWNRDGLPANPFRTDAPLIPLEK